MAAPAPPRHEPAALCRCDPACFNPRQMREMPVIMTQSFDTIIVGGGVAGCVLASRLSAKSSRSVLLLEAGQDTPPGREPEDVLDTYATSYYNDDYFWPDLKVHWRRKDNSPLNNMSQGRIMGGGSSVMGMVAYRGTPDDYAEWEILGVQGIRLERRAAVLPQARERFRFRRRGARQGRPDSDPPHQEGRLGAVVEGRSALRRGAADAVPCRHERRFPRRLRRGAAKQLAGQARLCRDLLSHRGRASAEEFDDPERRACYQLHVRRPPRHRREGAYRRRGKDVHRP